MNNHGERGHHYGGLRKFVSSFVCIASLPDRSYKYTDYCATVNARQPQILPDYHVTRVLVLWQRNFRVYEIHEKALEKFLSTVAYCDRLKSRCEPVAFSTSQRPTKCVPQVKIHPISLTGLGKRHRLTVSPSYLPKSYGPERACLSPLGKKYKPCIL